MTPETLPPDNQPSARFAPMLIDAMRLIRTLKSEYVAASELLQLALDMVREKDAAIDRKDAELDRLRARRDALITENEDLRRQLEAARRAA